MSITVLYWIPLVVLLFCYIFILTDKYARKSYDATLYQKEKLLYAVLSFVPLANWYIMGELFRIINIPLKARINGILERFK
jgi:hypothetical protein